jgi:hypothetical protein
VALDMPHSDSTEGNIEFQLNGNSTKLSSRKESGIGSGSKSPQNSTNFFLTTRLSSTQTKSSTLSSSGNQKFYINESIKNVILILKKGIF